MPEAEPRKELIDQRPPFVIRGHHLEKYYGLIGGNFTPVSLADIDLLYAQKLSPDPTYRKDVLGSPENAEKFKEDREALYELFLKLPDNYPAEIVEGVPDHFCNGCVIGKHCRELQSDFSGMKVDGSYLDGFIRKLALLNSPKPIISQEEAHFLDAEPQKVRRIHTTIGVIRKILKETEFNLWRPRIY